MRALFKDGSKLIVNYLDINEQLIAKQFLKLLETGTAKVEPIYNDYDELGGLRVLVSSGGSSEELNINANGRFDVKDYDFVNVDVEPTVSGEIEITDNGIYDVSQYATANVQVASSGNEELTPEDSDLSEEEPSELVNEIANGE